MTRRARQAARLLLASAFLLALAEPASARNGAEPAPPPVGNVNTRSAPEPAEAAPTLGFGELWDQMGDFFGGLVAPDKTSPDDKKTEKDKAAADAKDPPKDKESTAKDSPKEAARESPPAKEEGRATIEAKRLAPPEPAAAPAAPYKVYSFPTPAESEIPSSRSSLGGWGQEEESPSPAAPPREKALPAPLLRPASAIATSFFPLLPEGGNGRPQFLPLASNRPVGEAMDRATRAVLLIHDATRNAMDGAAMLATLAGADESTTLVLAPQFLLEIDVARFAAHLPDKGRDVARWPTGYGRDGAAAGWSAGGASLTARGGAGISSFTALDLLLLYLGDRERFPALERVVIAGHGAGADFVQRYAALGQAPDLLQEQALPVQFLAANPNSYLYFTPSRPATEGNGFANADESACPAVNLYPWGLNALPPYGRRQGGHAIRLRYPERSVIVLLGDQTEEDIFADRSCAAQAQGRNRLERGRFYARHLTATYGEAAGPTQKFALVPNAGYDATALFGSYCGLSVLFGDGRCEASLRPEKRR